MREIVEYQIERANTTGELVSIIHRAMDHGWQPLGAPFFSSGGMAYQAIVKYKEDTAQIPITEILRRAANNLIIRPDAPPMPVEQTPSTAPGWPAPGVYGDPAGGDYSQLLEAATFAMHALTDRRPGGVPDGEEALARLVAAIEGTELHTRWNRPAGGE